MGRKGTYCNFGHRCSICLGWTQGNHKNYEVRTAGLQAHLNSHKTSPKQSNGISHLTVAFCINSGADEAPAYPATWEGGPWVRGPPNVQNTKICWGFFRTGSRSFDS